jgi:hypothetical protein
MPLTRRGSSKSTARLSPEMKTLLLEGPWAIGLTLRTMPPHDELRRLWAIHGADLLRENPDAWFVGRDWFVHLVQD